MSELPPDGGEHGGSASKAQLAWCPTQSGTFTAYEPEWRYAVADSEGKSGEWQDVQRRVEYDRPDLGAPSPLSFGGVSDTIGLCGHAQAQAIAWLFAAKAEARGKHVEVRVQAYKVVYEIKAQKIEQANAPLTGAATGGKDEQR